MTNSLDQYEHWLNSPYITDLERQELRLLSGNTQELKCRFGGSLSFGTAGLRAILGLGTTTLNTYTIAAASAALAQLVVESGLSKTAIVCYDNRLNSREFAETTAAVLASCGIHVKLFSDMRPTPQLSFAIRHFGATCGVNITASHNPANYNGYKAYWADGAQLSLPQSDFIASAISNMSLFPLPCVKDYLSNGLITYIQPDFDTLYINQVVKACDFGITPPSDFSICYTPLHGVGGTVVPSIFQSLGISNLYYVSEQMKPDGHFKTLAYPNPEDPAAFALALKLGEAQGCDLLLATDPDCDRLGVMCKNATGYDFITGNQIGILLFDYIVAMRLKNNTMPQNPALVTTIVTSPMLGAMATALGVEVLETFTGFKHIAQAIEEGHRGGDYLLAFEESHGYMAGDYTRDKDGGLAASLICGCAFYYHQMGLTLSQGLATLYTKYGNFYEHTLNIFFNEGGSLAGMVSLMKRLRAAPPSTILGHSVRYVYDYLTGHCLDLEKRYRSNLALSGSNVLAFVMSGGNKIVFRPSGTEPKLKVYILLKGEPGQDLAKDAHKYSLWAEKIITQYSEV